MIIDDVQILTGGRTNFSFVFLADGERYVCRCPGSETSLFINRNSEEFACKKAAELGIDESLVDINPETGVKLSKFIVETRKFSFDNPQDIRAGIKLLKKLHQAGVFSPYGFDHLEQIGKLCDGLDAAGQKRIGQLRSLQEKVVKLDAYVKADNWPCCLGHGDPKGENFLVSGDKYYLIDWEYAGNKDIGYDISHYAAEIGRARSGGNWEITREDAAWYFEGLITDAQYRHIVACFAIEEFYWTIWAINRGTEDIVERCSQNAKRFSRLALELYEGYSLK